MRRLRLICVIIIALISLILTACVVQPETILPTSTLPSDAIPTPNPVADAGTNDETSSLSELGPANPPTGEAVSVAEPGTCEHLLWPLKDGASWAYRLTAPDGTTQDITLTASVDEFGASLTANGETRQLICGEGALAGLPPLPIAHPSLGSAIAGSNPSGDLLPSPAMLLPLGQPAGWDMEVDASGFINLPNAEGTTTSLPIMSGKIVLIHEAGDLEAITTPAGEFLSLPVIRDALFDVQVQAVDSPTQSVIVSSSTQLYYSEGVGLVKAEYLGGMVSRPGEAMPLEPGYVLELTSYILP